jgi:hypothetical protein
VSGEESELLLLLRNDWFQTITVFSLSPSFRHPENMNNILRNITANRILAELPVGEEMTLSYRIKPDMDPVAVGLHIVVDFTDTTKKRWYRSVGYSSVINIVANESSPMPDFKILALYGILALSGLLTFVLVRKGFSSTGNKM